MYAPGTFPYAGLGGWTPTPGELVYAYQVYSSGTLAAMVYQVSLLNPAGNIGAADLGNGGQAPSSMVLGGGVAAWSFTPDGLLGEHSTGVVFSSIKMPEMWIGSVIDGESSMGMVPSPGLNDIPEPATISLLALGAFGLLRRKR